MTSFYVTYHLEKIINMSYGGFYKNLHRNELRDIKMYGFRDMHGEKYYMDVIIVFLSFF